MVRAGLIIGVLCVAASGASAVAAEIPTEFQGRWGKPSECKVKENGLKLERSTVSFGGPIAQRVTLTVDAREVHEGQAMLTVKAVSGTPIAKGGPQVGDRMLLKRTGDMLQPVEVISQGKKMDTTYEPAIGLCS